MTRREFLGAAGAAAAADGWNAGPVAHLLPGVNHHRMLLKMSLTAPAARPPVLRVGSLKAAGERTDSEGRFWSFDIDGLTPATEYALRLEEAGGKPLTDPWPLKTLPHPDERVDKFRLLIYTCAGGHDGTRIPGTGDPYWVSVNNRRKLFRAALSRKPDAMIADGDHVYWDQRFARGAMTSAASPFVRQVMGSDFERDIPVLGTANEHRLLRAVAPQIADLYGTLFRSTPVHFIQDDHDYFENDEAIEAGISFPPDDFMMRLARATQRLFFPEHLPDAGRPAGLPGSAAGDRGPGLSECYGTLRFGRMAEILLYDCRRYCSLKGPHAELVPDVVERWLVRRMRESPAAHVVNVPSMPIGWSAGKWGEWYPDLLLDDGRIGTSKPKYYWQEGWRSQHNRLLAAASRMQRIPLFISGDLHALAHGRLHRYGALDLRRNPVHAVLSGPISTGPRAWPSSARGTPPQVPQGLEIDEPLRPLENNGFTIVDFLPERIDFQMFRWKMGMAEALLDAMEPFHRFTVERMA